MFRWQFPGRGTPIARWAAALMITSSTVVSVSAQAFYPMGDVPGGVFRSDPFDLTRDGSVVVGGSSIGLDFQYRAVRWTRDTGIQELTGLPGIDDSQANGVSNDGSIIVGSSGRFPCRWIDGVPTSLPMLPEWGSASADDVSADGRVAVGRFDHPTLGARPVRWADDEPITPLGMLNASRGRVLALSSDGNLAVGSLDFPLPRAAIWDELGNATVLPEPHPGRASQANGLTTDDSLIIGFARSDACTWTPDGTWTLLPGRGGDIVATNAYEGSDLGSVIVGRAETSSELFAVYWDASREMHNLQDELVSLGVDLDGWQLTRAQHVSSDGRVIAGIGINPDGNSEGWIAIIPSPGGVVLLATWLAAVGRRR